eukprot:TRINITY_DN35308_c0_g1_i3.p1 TRINITY_DN35308_c0_g1~~TRINITY_DN35308_c0_g1_i3.p1  ORF type:complete len:248 (-),score=56.19 TRINITY_DN35308_c0_g1_i3:249-992(-)
MVCTPHCSSAALIIDVETRTLQFLKLPSSLLADAGRYRWAGLACGRDGRLYCAPYNAGSVLVIETAARKVTAIGGAGSGQYKWSGAACGADGRLYFVPAKADFVLALQPSAETFEQFEVVSKGNAKWSGVAVGLDGYLYCAPYNKSSLLMLRPQISLPSAPGEGAAWRAAAQDTGAAASGPDDDEYAEERAELKAAMMLLFEEAAGQRQKGYRALQLRWHPDKNPEDPRRATILFQYLQELHFAMST